MRCDEFGGVQLRAGMAGRMLSTRGLASIGGPRSAAVCANPGFAAAIPGASERIRCAAVALPIVGYAPASPEGFPFILARSGFQDRGEGVICTHKTRKPRLDCGRRPRGSAPRQQQREGRKRQLLGAPHGRPRFGCAAEEGARAEQGGAAVPITYQHRQCQHRPASTCLLHTKKITPIPTRSMESSM